MKRISGSTNLVCILPVAQRRRGRKLLRRKHRPHQRIAGGEHADGRHPDGFAGFPVVDAAHDRLSEPLGSAGCVLHQRSVRRTQHGRGRERKRGTGRIWAHPGASHIGPPPDSPLRSSGHAHTGQLNTSISFLIQVASKLHPSCIQVASKLHPSSIGASKQH